MYHIYLINCPGRLLHFWTLRVGTYYIFTIFGKCTMIILQQNNKIAITKHEDLTKQGFFKTL